MTQRAPAPALPFFAPVEQRLRSAGIEHLGPAVQKAVQAGRPLATGARVAVAVGSRGIDRIAEVVRLTVSELRAMGAQPFIVPAMGSHGGATAEGQRALLAGYGVTERDVGAAVESSLDTVPLGRGRSAPFDRLAAAADGVVVVNRVKPHSILQGALGSGLAKMTVVGLGNHAGAKALHQAGLSQQLVPVAEALLSAAPVTVGIALVEDSLDRLALVEGVRPERFAEADRRLLATARAYLPTIPLDPLDGVVFVWMGKDISGSGMDPNVIGMHRRLGGPAERTIHALAALRLTAASHGNAIGIGMADVVPAALAEAVDPKATLTNATTSQWPEGVRIPPTVATEEQAIAKTCAAGPSAARVVIAQDSAHLERFLVSAALLPDIEAQPNLSVVGDLQPLRFDAAGALQTPAR